MTATTKTTAATLNATARDRAGKGSARALRREGKVPGVVYNKGGETLSLALNMKEVSQEYARGRFRSRLVQISVDGKIMQALPKDVQFHPVSSIIEHVDFVRVEPGVPVRVQVPVKFAGQEKSVGLKRGGVLNIVRHEIEFSCLPESIPQSIDINVQAMDIGDSVHIKDIALPKGITATIKRNFTVATIAGRKSEEEAPAATTATAATDAAAPAAGAAAPAAGAAAAPAAKKEEGKKK